MFTDWKKISFAGAIFLGILIGIFFFDYNTAAQPFELTKNDNLPYENGSCIVKIDRGSATVKAGTTDPNFWVELNNQEIGRNTEYRIGTVAYYSINETLTVGGKIAIHHGCNLNISTNDAASGSIFLDRKMKLPWIGWMILIIFLSWWGLIYLWDLYYYKGIHFKNDIY